MDRKERQEAAIKKAQEEEWKKKYGHHLLNKPCPKNVVVDVQKGGKTTKKREWKNFIDSSVPTAILFYSNSELGVDAVPPFAEAATKWGKRCNFLTVCVENPQAAWRWIVKRDFPPGVVHTAVGSDFIDALQEVGNYAIPYACLVNKGKIAQIGPPEGASVRGCQTPPLVWKEGLKRILPKLKKSGSVLTDVEKKYAQMLFDKIDKDNNLALSEEELVTALSSPVLNGGVQADPKAVKDQLYSVMLQFDKDHNGKIDFKEFLGIFNFMQLQNINMDDLCADDSGGATGTMRLTRVVSMIQENEETLACGTHVVTTRDEDRIRALFKDLDVECTVEDKTWWPSHLSTGGAYHFEWDDGGEAKVSIFTSSGDNQCIAETKYVPEEGRGEVKTTFYYGFDKE